MKSLSHLLILHTLGFVHTFSPLNFFSQLATIRNSHSGIPNHARLATRERNWLMEDFTTADGYIVNPYEILSVRRDSSRTEIRSSYLKLSKQYHPDAVRISEALPPNCQNPEQVRDAWERIKLSYEILSDRKMKLKYDRHSAINDPSNVLSRTAMEIAKWCGFSDLNLGLDNHYRSETVDSSSISNKIEVEHRQYAGVTVNMKVVEESPTREDTLSSTAPSHSIVHHQIADVIHTAPPVVKGVTVDSEIVHAAKPISITNEVSGTPEVAEHSTCTVHHQVAGVIHTSPPVVQGVTADSKIADAAKPISITNEVPEDPELPVADEIHAATPDEDEVTENSKIDNPPKPTSITYEVPEELELQIELVDAPVTHHSAVEVVSTNIETVGESSESTYIVPEETEKSLVYHHIEAEIQVETPYTIHLVDNMNVAIGHNSPKRTDSLSRETYHSQLNHKIEEKIFKRIAGIADKKAKVTNLSPPENITSNSIIEDKSNDYTLPKEPPQSEQSQRLMDHQIEEKILRARAKRLLVLEIEATHLEELREKSRQAEGARIRKSLLQQKIAAEVLKSVIAQQVRLKKTKSTTL